MPEAIAELVSTPEATRWKKEVRVRGIYSRRYTWKSQNQDKGFVTQRLYFGRRVDELLI